MSIESEIVKHLNDSLIKAAVQMNIFCKYTGKILDVRTARYFVDSDGNVMPDTVMSPEAYAEVIKNNVVMDQMNEMGYFPMEEN